MTAPAAARFTVGAVYLTEWYAVDVFEDGQRIATVEGRVRTINRLHMWLRRAAAHEADAHEIRAYLAAMAAASPHDTCDIDGREPPCPCQDLSARRSRGRSS